MRFRTFRIQVLSVIDGIQLEVATIDGGQMLIATDLTFDDPVGPRLYTQEGYGISPTDFTDQDVKIIGNKLRTILLERRMVTRG